MELTLGGFIHSRTTIEQLAMKHPIDNQEQYLILRYLGCPRKCLLSILEYQVGGLDNMSTLWYSS